ncbi:MAG: LysR family transcriptional regulator [Ideonella sp.]|nr:LysR family transcriptional regulator [Ideonella sp.]
MDLKQLEYFVQVAELGSYTRAANRLAVVQSALSRQVRALEVELRQPLFIRTGRGVTLTEPGKRLLEHGRGILQQVERARHDIESRRGEAGGRVVIGLPPSVSRTLTGPLVKAFRERLPNATLSVVEGLSAYVLEWLAIGRVDCAVVYNVAPSPAVDLQPVLDEPLYLVSARAAPGQGRLVGAAITLDEVAHLELVIPSQPHSVRMLLESALAATGLAPRVALEIESVPAMLDLVQHDGLHAVLALNAVEASGIAGAFRARPIGPPRLKTKLWIGTSAQRPRGPLLDRTSELLREMLLAQRL